MRTLLSCLASFLPQHARVHDSWAAAVAETVFMLGAYTRHGTAECPRQSHTGYTSTVHSHGKEEQVQCVCMRCDVYMTNDCWFISRGQGKKLASGPIARISSPSQFVALVTDPITEMHTDLSDRARNRVPLRMLSTLSSAGVVIAIQLVHRRSRNALSIEIREPSGS